ncbi:MAG: preprotein translocase subunit SecG [Pyrinomonadaceae bacterium]|nr:preprotein translocase subunit SecG [Blastocatellia bacterium]MCW5958301.1 preprotein translocase subunit SecG [Pyrinomonadaceae bacterium]
MLYVLYALFFISCIVLIGTVLLQPGKTDAGALFTSNISNAAFGPRGTASVLSKITIVAASAFMVLALLISMPALQGGVSVLQTTSETPTTTPAESNTNTAPAADANSNAAPATNSEAPASTEAPANK